MSLKSEVVDLKDQVSSLNSRISELDNVVAYLLNNLPQNANNASVGFSSLPNTVLSQANIDSNTPSDNFTPMMTQQPCLLPSGHLEHDDKKRKLKLEVNVFSQQNQSASAFNSYPLQSRPSASTSQPSFTNYDMYNPSLSTATLRTRL